KNIKYQVLNSILDYLPKNPRKFKHFLRYLSGLHESFLSRFDEDELNWRALYLAQLLRFEHPEFFAIMVNSEDILRDVSTGLLADAFKDTKENNEVEPKWKSNLNKILDGLENYRGDNVRRARILMLYNVMRETYLTVEQLRNHLLVLEVPELLTWKEYSKLIETLLYKDEKLVTKKLGEYISRSRKTKEIERVREFIRMLLRDRDAKLGKIADMPDIQEMEKQLTCVKEIMRICTTLLDIDELFAAHNAIFNSEMYMGWYGQLEKWAHFKKQVIYSDIRNLEKTLAIKMTTKVTAQASAILDVLLSERGHGVIECKIAFKAVEDDIITILEKSLLGQLFDRFQGSRGFGDLHDDKKRIGEKQLLFTPHVIFHNKGNYEVLKSISKKAPDNPLIRNNFLDYLTMLFLAALHGFAWVDRTEALKLFQNKEFMGIIWIAATSRPLNRRMVGTLESYRVAIRGKLSDNSILPIPKWWEDMLALIQKNDRKK
ncbi:hypothetical protein KAR91_29215, partial [Candidatus Pacearchaeota archaeon]|nr:hypothetical protein [Candidatus Pacearchaeota archaeon]